MSMTAVMPYFARVALGTSVLLVSAAAILLALGPLTETVATAAVALSGAALVLWAYAAAVGV